MQYVCPSEGTLWVCAPSQQAETGACLREASEAYQRARSRYDCLTLAGEGSGGAYCLMLAARFMPERVVIAPFAGGEIERFFALTKGWQQRLFAVCADVEILVPEDATHAQKRRLRRLMRLMHARQKEMRVMPGNREIARVLKFRTNSDRAIKTLA